LPIAVEVYTIRLVAADVDERGGAQDGGTRVAVDRQQPVSALEASAGRTPVVHISDHPTRVVRPDTPARIFHEAIGASRHVGREREESGVHAAEQDHEPDERRSARLATHSDQS
jgi:hypothetical protein